MAGPGYKRSWKNLLLNKRYQLRFTLFMVGISAVLMACLGWWVMRVANEATNVAIARVRGEACKKIPELTETPSTDDTAAVPMKLDDGSGSEGSAQPEQPPTPPAPPPPRAPPTVDGATALKAVANLWCITPASCTPAATEPLVIRARGCDAYVKKKLGDPASVEALRKAMITVVRCEGGQTVSVADAPEAEHHVTVQIDESSMTLTPTVPNDYADTIVQHWECEMRQASDIDAKEHGRHIILWVLIATGVVLSLGLAVYGIKMTHRVAGPLFKVSLYLAKMRDGRFDKVYSLRKGDQLVAFYDHFRTAHAGVVTLERADIDQLKAVIAAAEAAGCGDHEAVAELRKTLARKEKSLE
ncbi:MAG TPA: hypothetical protein VMJ10_15935 [Kofleriaceae bacterium]|nr:hypothetical protein [Kofleriaceae bacterium]